MSKAPSARIANPNKANAIHSQQFPRKIRHTIYVSLITRLAAYTPTLNASLCKNSVQPDCSKFGNSKPVKPA